MTDCTPWPGYRDRDGYGRLGGGGGLAHRKAYEDTKGPIPDGYEIDHLCNHRECVNPDHLEAVPRQVNIQRAFDARTHCKHGHSYTLRRGRHVCLTCDVDRNRRYRQRKRGSS